MIGRKEVRMGVTGTYYEIRIKNNLDIAWSAWFEGMVITHLEDGEAIVAGLVTDQAALHGLLDRVRSLNLTLVSVRPLPASQNTNE